MTDGRLTETSAPVLSFTYHRAIAPMMWVLCAIMLVEITVVHVVIALWSRWLALILSILSIVTLIWLVRFIVSLRRCPVLLTDDALIWRCGSLRSLTIARSDIGGVVENWTTDAVKTRDCFNAALIAYPNIVIALRHPVVMGRRTVTRLAHRLDDPGALRAYVASPLADGADPL